MQTQGPSTPLSYHLEVTPRLCRLHHAESVLLPRNRQLGWLDIVDEQIAHREPAGFVTSRPQGSVFLPQTLHLAACLPLGHGGLYRGGQLVRKGSLQSAHAYWPFRCVFFSTAASSLVKASANSLTPSSVSLSVTSFIGMPAFAKLSITFCAPCASSVRLFLTLP